MFLNCTRCRYKGPARHVCGVLHLRGFAELRLAFGPGSGKPSRVLAVFDCEVVVVTEEAFFADIRSSPAGHALQQICPLKLVSLDDLVAEPWQYGMRSHKSVSRVR